MLIKYSPGNDIDFFLHKLVHPSKASSNKAGIRSLIGLIAGFTSTLIIVVWLLLRWRIKYIRKREEKKRKQIEIELRGIRAHMNPHFMFNSLGSIQNLINQSKVQEANLYLSKFAGLMRLILNNSEKEFVPLTGEIDAIRTYCELEQLRFGFDYNINIDNNIDIFNTEIPGMLIQPYVENAILHGINYLEKRAGKLDISFKMENNLLICTINDNGIGRQASQALKSTRSSNTNGFGFRLSKERIDLLNSQGKHISLNITDNTNEKGEAEGTTVEIKIETND